MSFTSFLARSSAKAKKIKRSFRGTGRIYRTYWVTYGGISEIITSIYFLTAVVISLICSGIWMEASWWDLPIAILPNLIGFTLGGYAILLAFGDKEFLAALVAPVDDAPQIKSPFLEISATFMHYLLVEISSLLLAVIAKSRPFSSWENFLNIIFHFQSYPSLMFIRRFFTYVLWFFGFSMFIYAICLSLASAAAIFRIAGWYQAMQQIKHNKSKNSPRE